MCCYSSIFVFILLMLWRKTHVLILIYLFLQMCIDTLFLCFCEDCERNDGIDRPYYMSRGLMVGACTILHSYPLHYYFLLYSNAMFEKVYYAKHVILVIHPISLELPLFVTASWCICSNSWRTAIRLWRPWTSGKQSRRWPWKLSGGLRALSAPQPPR